MNVTFFILLIRNDPFDTIKKSSASCNLQIKIYEDDNHSAAFCYYCLGDKLNFMSELMSELKDS